MFKLNKILSVFKIKKLKINKSLIPLVVAIAGVILVVVAIVVLSQVAKSKKSQESSKQNQEIAQKSLDYVNKNLLGGTATTVTAVLGDISEESGLVKMKIAVGSNEIESYATKDGKLFFPQAFNMEEVVDNSGSNGESEQKSCEELKKAQTPLLDAFVVSKCPYGLQMQRILAEVVKNIPQLASDIKVRYLGSISGNTITSMHGDAEAQENLRQICLREETNKYWSYISCYIQKGEADNCLSSVGANKTELQKCIADSARGLKYAKEDFDLQDKYKASGSPTLILNEEEVSEFWFGGRTAEALKTLLCCGFNKDQGVCSQTLSKDQAATGLSETYSSGDSSNNSGGCE